MNFVGEYITFASAVSRSRQETWKCTMCNKYYSSTEALAVHIRTHNKETSKTYSCSECNKKFTGQYGLNKHTQEAIHNSISCKICKEEFVTRCSLMVHRHREHDSKVFSCQICSKMLSSKGNLTRHIQRVHHKSEPFVCLVCQARFARKWALTKHLQAIHHNLRKASSKVCKETLSTKYNIILTKHMQTKHQNS